MFPTVVGLRYVMPINKRTFLFLFLIMILYTIPLLVSPLKPARESVERSGRPPNGFSTFLDYEISLWSMVTAWS